MFTLSVWSDNQTYLWSTLCESQGRRHRGSQGGLAKDEFYFLSTCFDLDVKKVFESCLSVSKYAVLFWQVETIYGTVEYIFGMPDILKAAKCASSDEAMVLVWTFLDKWSSFFFKKMWQNFFCLVLLFLLTQGLFFSCDASFSSTRISLDFDKICIKFQSVLKCLKTFLKGDQHKNF